MNVFSDVLPEDDEEDEDDIEAHEASTLRLKVIISHNLAIDFAYPSPRKQMRQHEICLERSTNTILTVDKHPSHIAKVSSFRNPLL